MSDCNQNRGEHSRRGLPVEVSQAQGKKTRKRCCMTIEQEALGNKWKGKQTNKQQHINQCFELGDGLMAYFF